MNESFRNHSISIECCEEQLLLHPDKVVYWPAVKTLLAADIHIGKEHTFARAGIPVPGGISEHTLNTLMTAVDNSQAERLIILGDLLHATPDANETWQKHLTNQLQQRCELDLQVIIGNHDKLVARNNVQTPLNWIDILSAPPFVFRHEPMIDKEGYVISGHIHPVYRLSAGRHQRLRAPVFWFRNDYAVLPAFGKFTGGHSIEIQQSDRVFMVGGRDVMQVCG